MSHPSGGPTDWNSDYRLAFEFGVASVLGRADTEAWEALKAGAESRYERQLLELAYEEGSAKATELRRNAPVEEVWNTLIEGDQSPKTTLRYRDGPRDGPPSSLDRPTNLSRPEKSFRATRLPRFLRRY